MQYHEKYNFYSSNVYFVFRTFTFVFDIHAGVYKMYSGRVHSPSFLFMSYSG